MQSSADHDVKRSHMIKSYDLCKMAVVGIRKVLCVVLVIVLFVEVYCDVSSRKVSVTSMPDCNIYPHDCAIAVENGTVVVFATAYSKDDSLFYAFSNIGLPTIILTRITGGDVSVNFNWTKLVKESSLKDAITFEGPAKVDYRMALAFPRLIEYNDLDDDADLNHEDGLPHNASYWIVRDFKNFNWTVDASGPDQNSFALNATTENGLLPNGTGNWSISFKFTVQEDSGRASQLPSLKYGANETMFDFIISNFTPTYSKSRFAVETVFVSQSTSDMSVETTDSIDDEYSPGVFQIVNWLSNPSARESSGYIQWKPVCYTSDDRSRSTGTKVKNYDLSHLKDREYIATLLNSSIVFSIFGDDLYDEKTVTSRATNISFGLSEDEFFVKTNYTVWTAAIGYGTPPEDTISLTVIITISAGLGLPVLILILGGVYTCVKKRRSGYNPANTSVDRNQPVIN